MGTSPPIVLVGSLPPPTNGQSIAFQTLVDGLREAGERVIQELPGQSGGARELGCDRIALRRGEEWEVVELE